jgi:hypothetical protein
LFINAAAERISPGLAAYPLAIPDSRVLNMNERPPHLPHTTDMQRIWNPFAWWLHK